MKINSAEIEVAKEDQVKINTFSRLNMNYHDLQRQIQIKKEQISQLADGLEEMELMDDDEKIQYKFGDSFIRLTVEKVIDYMIKARKLTEQQQEDLKKQQQTTVKQLDEIHKQMKNLKAKLYAKFGNQINLEDD